MRSVRGCVVALLFVLGCAVPVSSAEPAAPLVKTHLDRVSLFKNGLAYFQRQGALPAGQHAVRVGPFAAPVHGTFWVSTPTSTGLQSVLSRAVRVPGEAVEAREIGDLLRANVGREVMVWTGTEPTAAPLTGTILSFAPDRSVVVDPLRNYQMGTAGVDPGYRNNAWGRGEYMLLRTTDGVVGLNPYAVVRVKFTGDVATRYQAEEMGAELEASLKDSKAGDWIGISYLAKGLTWAPSYLVDVTDPKAAVLTASALIVDEAEDLDDTHVDLITGFPNLQFADILSPIGRKTDLAGFLQQLGGGGRTASASVMTQRVMSNMAMPSEGAAGPMPDYGAGAAGRTSEDLFLYPLEHVTLKAGDTGYYPLFTVRVAYTDFYQWVIPDYASESDFLSSRSPQPETREVVWHSLRLANSTDSPWTTAPTMVVKEGQILGQDILDFTPRGSKGLVRITQAVNLQAQQNEIEVTRQTDVEQRYGYHYDRVTIKGTLAVTNRGDKAVSLEVQKTLSGVLVDSTPTAQVVALPVNLQRVNVTNRLTWTVELAPGKAQEIVYTYTALIRR